MPADSYYDDLNDRLAGPEFCLGEDECEGLDRESTAEECNEAILLGAEEEDAQLCEECGHAIGLHMDRYGCQYERGDAWVTGNQAGEPTVLMAQGPCSCKAHAEEFERLERRKEFDKALRDYAAAVKRYGKALVDLGRACDGKEGL